MRSFCFFARRNVPFLQTRILVLYIYLITFSVQETYQMIRGKEKKIEKVEQMKEERWKVRTVEKNEKNQVTIDR